MQRTEARVPQALHSIAATRRLEQAAMAMLAPHTLMQRAGLAVARLCLAVAPHARKIWVACGPGNNGGDGLEAAVHLRAWGKQVVVTWLGDDARLPADAAASLARARNAGVPFLDEPPGTPDLVVDALLGIGATRAPEGQMATWIARMKALPAPVLAVDAPSGLDVDTGRLLGAGTGPHTAVVARWTLSLLTLKPGLFTGHGRDHAGEVWLDGLGVNRADSSPAAWLGDRSASTLPTRLHASHKGSHGDVVVLGGAPGMTGAALLAARAALEFGAGRVFVGLLDGGSMKVDPVQPELMFRDPMALPLDEVHVACGCGGSDAVREVLPVAIARAGSLVIDADGLNAVAADSGLRTLLAARGRRAAPTIITPHPLEAARLLGSTSALVQSDRLAAAQDLARQFACVVVLKGSGTVTASPSHEPVVNPTGNPKLATAGTGDVLAGMIAARLAQGDDARLAALRGVWHHGARADEAAATNPAHGFTASGLIHGAPVTRNPFQGDRHGG